MAYGSDISEGLPLTLSNPAGATYTPSGYAYDVAIAGLPFFVSPLDESPYRRVTAQYRKQQLDTSREPGEQTLTGWWLRSQSSFHFGQGIKFFEPVQDESLRFQYTESKGLNVWEKGQCTLLHTTTTSHFTTGGIRPDGRPWQIARSVRPNWTVTNKALTSNVATLTIGSHKLTAGDTVNVSNVDTTFNGTYVLTAVASTTISYAKTADNVVSVATTGNVSQDAILLMDEYDADIIDAGGNLRHFIDYNAGSDYPVYAICDDGVYAYWVTNQTSGGAKMAVYKKALTDDSSVSPTLMFTATGIVITNAVIEYTKERIILCANDKIYEFSGQATTLPTAIYSHNDPNHVFTSITSSGAAIYVAGYSGIQSNIYKFTLESTGAMPTLTSAITAAELPVGEVAYKVSYYLGYMAIGTSLGVRVAQISDSDGSIAYGPLLFESTQPVYDFAFRDRYVWAASGVDGQAGVTRIDLGQELTPLVFPYAWDLYDPTDTELHWTTTCAFIGETNRLAFITAGNGTDGNIYLESATDLMEEGYLQTGFVRYNTLETKIFKQVQARIDTTNGALNMFSIQANGVENNIGTFAQGDPVPEVNVAYPTTAQEYLGFKFLLKRSTTDDTQGPLFTGYQVKALPAIPRQRLIQYPVMCYDHEMDKFNNEVGSEGSAYDRLAQLEAVENVGDTIRIEDFRTGESYIGLIEEMDFINRTPPSTRFSGFGGVLLVTIRSV